MSLRQIVNEYEQYLKQDNYDYVFNHLNRNDMAEFVEFLYNKCGIDVLSHMTSIPKYMFKQADISKLTVPSTITTIGDDAFVGSMLNSIYINDSVEDIGIAAFWGCKNLNTVRLPNGIEKLNNQLFMNCSSLQKIYIPESVTTFGSKVFDGCPDDIIIVTKYRSGALDKLKFPGNEVDFYKEHLKFKRA